MKVFKLEIMVIDHDNIGYDEIKSVIENARYPNRCISPEIKSGEFASIEWSDDHPLNNRNTCEAEYIKLFTGKDND